MGRSASVLNRKTYLPLTKSTHKNPYKSQLSSGMVTLTVKLEYVESPQGSIDNVISDIFVLSESVRLINKAEDIQISIPNLTLSFYDLQTWFPYHLALPALNHQPTCTANQQQLLSMSSSTTQGARQCQGETTTLTFRSSYRMTILYLQLC